MTDPTPSVQQGSHGGQPPRGLDLTPSSPTTTGRYGRLFRNLPTYDIADASLIALAEVMIQPIEDGQLDKPVGVADDDENTAVLDNGELRLPAGYTYFGQFVDHDITFDPASSLTRQNDPDALVDFRTPRFDLDSVYGKGPADQPYLYDADGVHLTLGHLTASGNAQTGGPDLQRVESGRAIIGDPRNDENLIVSQLQVTIIRFHNVVADQVISENPSWSGSDHLKKAQQVVRWHYQWIVVHDFLPRIVGQDVVDDIFAPATYAASGGPVSATLKPRLEFYHFKENPYMPVEFSVAAYRFGHSMIRPSYKINDVAVTDPPVADASRIPLFDQTGVPKQSLNGFRPLPDDWGVQWKFFLPGINGAETTNAALPQPSYKIDETLSHPLGALPSSTAGPELISAGFEPTIAQSLAIRNLLRGKRLALPSGQDVAKAMGIVPLTDAQLFDGLPLAPEVLSDLAGKSPLWFYILREAKVLADAAHLGPVGGRIVAEVLIGLLVGDRLSFINVEPNWKPLLPSREAGTFTLTDLINVAVPAPPVVAPAPSPYGA